MKLLFAFAVSLSTISALPFGTALADDRLSGAEISKLLSGNTAIAVDVTPPRWRQFFSPDGNTAYYSMSRPPSAGGWRIEGNQYCSVWPPSDRWECYDVLLDARSTETLPVIIWRSARGGDDVSAVLSGDQTIGRTPDSVRAIGK